MAYVEMGQRYLWSSGPHKFICEITNVQDASQGIAGMIILQVLEGAIFRAGSIYESETITGHNYSLLEGQEAPKK